MKKKEKQQGLKLKHRPKVVVVTGAVAAVAADLRAAADKGVVSRAVVAAKEVAVVAGDNNYTTCRL